MKCVATLLIELLAILTFLRYVHMCGCIEITATWIMRAVTAFGVGSIGWLVLISLRHDYVCHNVSRPLYTKIKLHTGRGEGSQWEWLGVSID